MYLDWFIFPSPEPSYTYDNIRPGKLIYIPKKKYEGYDLNQPQNNACKHIPCLLLIPPLPITGLCPKYAIFFHGNAEDINLAYDMLSHIRYTLSINVLAPEFPGYGIYSGYPTEDQLFNDSLCVFDYMVNEMRISPNNIIVFGRSLGTSIATHLASKRNFSALVLISPLLSIRNVVKDMLGKLVAYAVKERFKSYQMIENVQCPILIIHGQIDSLIDYYHANELYNKAKAPCELILPENMEHNEFDFFHEFSEPLLDFISRNSIFSFLEQCKPIFKNEIIETPSEFKKPPKNWNCITTLLKKLNLT